DPLSAPGMEGHFRHRSLFVGPADRRAVNEGRADYVPIFLYEIPNLFHSGEQPIDVAVIHTSPPDEHGFLSYGVETLCTKAAVENAKFVIAQVNENMPRVLGDSFVHVSRVDRIVEVSEELPELKLGEFTDVEKKIGKYIADLIEDGATLQLGIGGIPNATLFFLKDKKNLGIHSEMASDGIMDAIESGIITGSEKTLHKGKVIATFILGSKELYDFVDNNPVIECRPCDYTNDPFVVAQNDKMVAVNSAIEVDLSGQVCSDSIGYRIYSGFGGQVDFIRGATRSKHGKPIIAVPSVTKNGVFSRIVSHLKEGAGVVTSRGDVHYVVTEYGVAYLHGKSLRERAKALINIAHPNFRGELERFAAEKNIL
ncbi:MAG TPA: acetyl-CoA hydrolase/transferase family protein, partial [Bacteroidetes bacterium]|nr:acetyl-CoA hydrolase/transferase family protein [Bacteroidota bacterium]